LYLSDTEFTIYGHAWNDDPERLACSRITERKRYRTDYMYCDIFTIRLAC